MSKNNSQVSHLWAQQNQGDKIIKNHNGSFWASGRSIYSYRTEIGRFYNNIVVYTKVRYSATTSSKHLPAVRQAISHRENYAINEDISSLPDSWEQTAEILLQQLVQNVADTLASLKKCRSGIDWTVRQLINSAVAAVSFDTFHINQDKGFSLPLALPWKDVLLLADTSHLDAPSILRESFNIDVFAKLQREQEHNQRKAAKEQEQAAKRIEQQKEKIQQWRNGQYNYPLYDLPVMLRLAENQVETSRGATVDIDDSIALYKGIKAGLDLTGYRIGPFTVTKLSADCITIGCHTIPLSEIETIAKQLNLE